MVHEDLPVNIDSSYTDDGAHPDVKIHQTHHDELHFFHNLFKLTDVATWPDGGVPFWNDAADEFQVIDPEIAGSPGPPGADGTSLTPKGTYAVDVAYVKGDVVREAGATYACKLANTGAAVTNTTYWMLMTTDGAQGDPGSSGAAGAPGQTGPPGPTESNFDVFPDLTDTFTVDAGLYDYLVGTLTEDCEIDFEDSSGAAVSALTMRLYQGAGGPFAVTWTGITWMTTDGLEPDLSGMSAGDFVVLAFDQVAGVWCGYAPGAGTGVAPPSGTYPTLAFDVPYTSTQNADQSTDYVGSTNFQIGNSRVGHAFVMTTMATVDPPVPTLSGGGATSGWTQGATQLQGTGATRRRITHFVAQDAVSGAAAPLVVGIGGQLHTGCAVVVIRTTRSPATAKALAVAKSVSGSGTGTSSTCTLAAASDAANRGIACGEDNGTTTVVTAEANWDVLSPTPLTMINPTIRAHAIANTTSFDTTPSFSLSGPLVTGIIATECEQGPTV
jgi:hypothetical protein